MHKYFRENTQETGKISCPEKRNWTEFKGEFSLNMLLYFLHFKPCVCMTYLKNK